MLTLTDAVVAHGFDVLDQLDRQAEIPFLSGIQFQGDLTVIPVAERPVSASGARSDVGRAGVPVIPGGGGRHEHRLFAHAGTCWWTTDVVDSAGLAIGVLTVEPGSQALLAHEEHGYNGVAPGEYVLGRQREEAEEQRLVAD